MPSIMMEMRCATYSWLSADSIPTSIPHPASTVNLEAAASPGGVPSSQGVGQSTLSHANVAKEPAVKGGIAQAKGGTLSMQGRAVTAATHTLERLQQCLGMLSPLPMDLPEIPESSPTA